MSDVIEFLVLYRDAMKYWPAQTLTVSAATIEDARAAARAKIESFDWSIQGAPDWIDVAAMVAPIPVDDPEGDRPPYLDFIVTVLNQRAPTPGP
jgi:hypothetical protein